MYWPGDPCIWLYWRWDVSIGGPDSSLPCICSRTFARNLRVLSLASFVLLGKLETFGRYRHHSARNDHARMYYRWIDHVFYIARNCPFLKKLRMEGGASKAASMRRIINLPFCNHGLTEAYLYSLRFGESTVNQPSGGPQDLTALALTRT